jgi:hypothetical protein
MEWMEPELTHEVKDPDDLTSSRTALLPGTRSVPWGQTRD